MEALPLLSEVVGQRGICNALGELRQSQPLSERDVTACMDRHRVDSSAQSFQALVRAGILGAHAGRYFVSSLGQKTSLLLSAINGADIGGVVAELAQFHPSIRPYELVTEGMADTFINDLENRPDFKRVFICSPWVHLREKLLRKFMYALHKAQKLAEDTSKIEVIVIARPLSPNQSGYGAFKKTFEILIKLGAEIVVHPKVHAKLYIREPSRKGGISLAVVGSENLTGRRNIELGIRITNDTAIIRKLIAYYFDVYAKCKPFDMEEGQ